MNDRIRSGQRSWIVASDRPQFGENCFILEGSVFNFDVKVGNDVVLWSANHVGDLCVIEDHVWISSRAALSEEVTVSEQSFRGVNATVSNHVCVGPRSYIGANALIVKDTVADSVHVTKGTPPVEHIDSLRFLQMIKS